MNNFDKLAEILTKYSQDVVAYKLDAEFAYAVSRAAGILELLSYGEDGAWTDGVASEGNA